MFNADMDPAKIQPVHEQPLSHNGGFLSFRVSATPQVHDNLKQRGVLTDFRGDILRFGMAPYITSQQIDQAIGYLQESLV